MVVLGSPEGHQRRAEHEVAVARGQYYVSIRLRDLHPEGSADAPATGRATALEERTRLLSTMVGTDIGPVANGVVEQDRIRREDLAELVANPAGVERPAPARLLGAPFGGPSQLLLPLLQPRATVSDLAAVGRGEHAGGRVVDRARCSGRRGRQPQVGTELHRLVARLDGIDIDPGDVRVALRAFARRQPGSDALEQEQRVGLARPRP